ncbi:hypothetical protein HK405_006853 [Cladochytrium tenue]|nr:hypothetical protein HK405_006853 [Cladochytrium tenue]
MSLAGQSLPAEVLDAILMWLHPHQVYELRRLSHALFDAVDSFCATVSFASRNLRNLEVNRSFGSWVHARYENARVDFARLPLSYTIALFMNEGCSFETFVDVFGDYSWPMLDEPVAVELTEKVADALENILIESPGRFKSFGQNPAIWLYLITKVGRSELTRVAVKRATDEFIPPLLQDALNMALIGAFISGNQAVVDCILVQMEVQPKEAAFAYVACQPDLNLARSFLSWYTEKFGEAPTNYLSKAVLFAAQNGHCGVAEHLLTLHSDLTTLNFALMYAAKDAHIAVCRLLLSAGADPLDNDAWALTSAFDSNSAEVVELLLRDTRVKQALEADGTKRTRLIKAAARKGVAALRPFIELGVAHLEDAAMLYAAPHTDIGPEGKAELLRFVLQKDIRVNNPSFYGHHATVQMLVKLMEPAVARIALAASCPSFGHTPLMLAASQGRHQTMKILIAAGREAKPALMFRDAVVTLTDEMLADARARVPDNSSGENQAACAAAETPNPVVARRRVGSIIAVAHEDADGLTPYQTASNVLKRAVTKGGVTELATKATSPRFRNRTAYNKLIEAAKNKKSAKEGDDIIMDGCTDADNSIEVRAEQSVDRDASGVYVHLKSLLADAAAAASADPQTATAVVKPAVTGMALKAFWTAVKVAELSAEEVPDDRGSKFQIARISSAYGHITSSSNRIRTSI